jgi:hypothetical protein
MGSKCYSGSPACSAMAGSGLSGLLAAGAWAAWAAVDGVPVAVVCTSCAAALALTLPRPAAACFSSGARRPAPGRDGPGAGPHSVIRFARQRTPTGPAGRIGLQGRRRRRRRPLASWRAVLQR